jgi:actin-related protein
VQLLRLFLLPIPSGRIAFAVVPSETMAMTDHADLDFVTCRLPPLLRAKNLPISDVQIVPPPRNLNPRFVSWKGASVICNLDSLSDMWIRKDEWEAIGARALKDRCLFL